MCVEVELAIGQSQRQTNIKKIAPQSSENQLWSFPYVNSKAGFDFYVDLEWGPPSYPWLHTDAPSQ